MDLKKVKMSAADLAPVLIVGAGVTGLQVAHNLQQVGVRAVVLEASFHVGGRVRTVRERDIESIPASHQSSPQAWLQVHRPSRAEKRTHRLGEDDFLFEVGAEFIHGARSPAVKYLQQGKWRFRQLFTWAQGDGGPSAEPSPSGRTAAYYIGPIGAGASGGQEKVSNGKKKKKKKSKQEEEEEEEKKHKKKNEQLLPWNSTDADFQRLNQLLQSLCDMDPAEVENDRRSMQDWLVDNGVSPRFLALAEAGYANTVGGTLADTSLYAAVKSEIGYLIDGEHDLKVLETLENTLVKHLSQGLTIVKGDPVVSIEDLPNSAMGKAVAKDPNLGCGGPAAVRLRTRAGRTYTGCAVVVTASLPALRTGLVRFSPPLPERLQGAINGVRYGAGALKLLAKFDACFWPATLDGLICAGCDFPEFWFEEKVVTCPMGKKAKKSLYYITAFAMADFAKRLAEIGHAAAVDLLLEQLEDMFCKAPPTARQGGEKRHGQEKQRWENNRSRADKIRYFRPGTARAAYCGSLWVDWSRVPYVHTGYSCASLREPRWARPCLRQPYWSGRLHFAGEHTTAVHSPTINGAQMEGVRVARELCQQLLKHAAPPACKASMDDFDEETRKKLFDHADDRPITSKL